MEEFSVGDIGIKFKIQIFNNDQPGRPKVVDLTNNSKLELEFRRPNNTIFRVDAEATDDTNLDNTSIELLDDRVNGSILDFPGFWEYTSIVTLANGTVIKGVDKIQFYVHL